MLNTYITHTSISYKHIDHFQYVKKVQKVILTTTDIYFYQKIRFLNHQLLYLVFKLNYKKLMKAVFSFYTFRNT